MKLVTLETKTRPTVGRKASRDLRKNGRFPAVLYGESGVRHLSLNAHDFEMAYKAIVGRAALIELNIAEEEDESNFAVIQELTRHPLTDRVIHVDLKEVVRGKEMETIIPVVAFGVPAGVKNQAGVLDLSADTVSVRCRPRNLPENITVDVRELTIGDSVHLSDLTPPEGVEFLDDPDMVIAACVGAVAEVEEPEPEEDEDQPTEPEVITAKSDSEEDSE